MFSVLIPTFNRSETLKLTIDGYLRQSAPYLIDEIIIIDDGSDERHRNANSEIVAAAAIKAGFPVKYIYQENTGPAEARNKGIGMACGDMILMTGDDIVPHVNLIKEHFFTHKKFDLAGKICVLGHSVWPPDINVTPFMRHIEEKGLQFGYSIIPDPEDVPFNFFYTSNISLHRKFLLEGSLFDTNFPFAAWEDVELSYRLKKSGMRIVYNKNAIGYHYHPITFASFRGRQEKCGYSAYILYEKHRELKQFLGINDELKYSLTDILRLNIEENICLLLEKYGVTKSRPVSYDRVMGYYYQRGIEKYRNKASGIAKG